MHQGGGVVMGRWHHSARVAGIVTAQGGPGDAPCESWCGRPGGCQHVLRTLLSHPLHAGRPLVERGAGAPGLATRSGAAPDRWWYLSLVPAPRTRGEGPGPLARRILLKQTFPGAVARPQAVALVDRLPWATSFGQVTPPNPGPHPVLNPVDHPPVIPPPATTPVADWQERPQPFPLGIRQVAPPHVYINDPGAE